MVKVPEGYRSRNVNDRRTATGGRGRGGSDLLGGMLGGNATGGGLLGSLGSAALTSILGSMLGGGGGGGLGGLLGSILGGGSSSAPELTSDQRDEADDQATLLLRAMVNAAKADGRIDQDEMDNIVKRMGDIDEEEAAFLRAELQAPLDISDYCSTVPEEMAQQAYAFSVLGMKLDTQQEANYLGAMAQGLRLDPRVCNEIHTKLGAPTIFQ